MKLRENPLNAKSLLEIKSIPGVEAIIGEHKVRRMFVVPTGELVTIVTDRMGAFDQPHLTEEGLPAHYPGKGIIINQFVYFGKTQASRLMPTDFLPDTNRLLPIPSYLWPYASLSVRAKKMVPVEFIVRTGCEGSMAEKASTGKKICGQKLSKNLRLGQPLSRPIFTPTTKSAKGSKDLDLTIDEYYSLLKEDRPLANYLYGMTILLHLQNKTIARRKGLDRPDQKFEFGIFEPGQTVTTPPTFEWEFSQESLKKICGEAGFSEYTMNDLPQFDPDEFIRYSQQNAKTYEVRLCDETYGTDDGRYRIYQDTRMGIRLYDEGRDHLAEVFMKNYLCKEYFRLESKKTGKGGYDKDAKQPVIIPTPVLLETGRRNLIALLMLTW